MKYKVGDEVRVREDLEVGKDYGNYYVVVEDMKEYKGKEFIIHEVWRNCYRLKDIGYYWTDEMLEPIEREINNMNIEELNKEYKSKMDTLMEEYKEKIEELTKAGKETEKEKPYIEEGQEYFAIDNHFRILTTKNYNCEYDIEKNKIGNCYPFTDETKDKVFKEVKLTAERRKLQSEMEMFARQNNEGEINWNDDGQAKWYIYVNYLSEELGIDFGNSCKVINTTYFASKEIAEKALDKFGDRIRKLYVDMEG